MTSFTKLEHKLRNILPDPRKLNWIRHFGDDTIHYVEIETLKLTIESEKTKTNWTI